MSRGREVCMSSVCDVALVVVSTTVDVTRDLPCQNSSSSHSAIGRLTEERKDPFAFIQQITDDCLTHLQVTQERKLDSRVL